jgi:hypothetical protein
MDRRNFLRKMIGGVAAAAAVRTFPFRVYSFPTELSYPGRLSTPGPYWGYDFDPATNTWAAVQAIELENLRREIPDLLRGERRPSCRFRRRAFSNAKFSDQSSLKEPGTLYNPLSEVLD